MKSESTQLVCSVAPVRHSPPVKASPITGDPCRLNGWLDCWEADCYGSRYVLMPDSDLKSTTQAKYRKQLETLGLFMFEIRKQGSDRRLWVLNLHGSRVKNFWKPIAKTFDETEQASNKIEQTLDRTERILDPVEQVGAAIQAGKGFQSASTSSQDLLNIISSTPQRSDEMNGVEKDTQPPLAVASNAEIPEEEVATDSATLLTSEEKDSSAEPRPLDGDSGSAADAEYWKNQARENAAAGARRAKLQRASWLKDYQQPS